jgi:hypothetical protein
MDPIMIGKGRYALPHQTTQQRRQECGCQHSAHTDIYPVKTNPECERVCVVLAMLAFYPVFQHMWRLVAPANISTLH